MKLVHDGAQYYKIYFILLFFTETMCNLISTAKQYLKMVNSIFNMPGFKY